jgi:hypothetical protein
MVCGHGVEYRCERALGWDVEERLRLNDDQVGRQSCAYTVRCGMLEEVLSADSSSVCGEDAVT